MRGGGGSDDRGRRQRRGKGPSLAPVASMEQNRNKALASLDARSWNPSRHVRSKATREWNVRVPARRARSVVRRC